MAERKLPADPVAFIRECLRGGRILWTYHVNMRLDQRFIARETIIAAAESYEIVETYPDDKYFPSYLLLGQQGEEAFHALFGADLIASAGHSRGLYQILIEGRCARGSLRAEQWPPQGSRPRNASVPSSRSSQGSGLCPKTLLASVRLGGGTAMEDLVTHYQENEGEKQSNQTARLRAATPDARSRSEPDRL